MVARMPNQIGSGHATPTGIRQAEAPSSVRLTIRRSTGMARIIGGVAASHTPTIGFAYDQNKQDDPSWGPIFQAFKPVEDWFKEKRPDAIVYIFNDHVTSFFFDHYSAFTLGIGEEYPVADEGGNPRQLPAIKGDPKLAAHIATSLVT